MNFDFVFFLQTIIEYILKYDKYAKYSVIFNKFIQYAKYLFFSTNSVMDKSSRFFILVELHKANKKHVKI